jgi:hypothetical protein
LAPAEAEVVPYDHIASLYDDTASGVQTNEDERFCLVSRSSHASFDTAYWQSQIGIWLNDPTGWEAIGLDKVNFVADCDEGTTPDEKCETVNICFEGWDALDPLRPCQNHNACKCCNFGGNVSVEDHDHPTHQKIIFQVDVWFSYWLCQGCDLNAKRGLINHEVGHILGERGTHSGPESGRAGDGGIWDGPWLYNGTPGEIDRFRAHLDGEPARAAAPCVGFPQQDRIEVSWFDAAIDETSNAVDVYRFPAGAQQPTFSMNTGPVGGPVGSRVVLTSGPRPDVTGSGTVTWMATPLVVGGQRGIPNSNPISGINHTGAGFPAKPCTLKMTALGNEQIQLTWLDGSFDETGFAIYYQYARNRPDGTDRPEGQALYHNEWYYRGTVSANTESYSDNMSATSYLQNRDAWYVCAKVVALSNGQPSFDSNYACTTLKTGALDTDTDGFANTTETSVTTNLFVPCGYAAGGNPYSENWPPDLVKSNTVTIQDVLALKPVFGTSVPPTAKRYDLVPNGSISITDVMSLKPWFGKSCTTFGGQGGGPTPNPSTETPTPVPLDPVDIAVDADPDGVPGNTAASLGTRESCTSVVLGNTVTVDITAANIQGLAFGSGGLTAFEFKLSYDPTKVKVTAYDYSLLLAANGGILTPVGNFAPDTDGTFHVAVGDFGSSSPESGAGVLGRITLEGLTAGHVDLELDDIVLNDAQGNEYEIETLHDGCIEVEPP